MLRYKKKTKGLRQEERFALDRGLSGKRKMSLSEIFDLITIHLSTAV